MTQQLRDLYLQHHYTYELQENLRFELAHSDDENYHVRVAEAKARAGVLFDAVFKGSTKIQLIFFVFADSRHNYWQKFFHRNHFKVKDSFTTHSWGEPTTVMVIETEKANLRLGKLLDGICYQDFFEYGKLKIHSPFVFYNEATATILNIYDDRGCDIWSAKLPPQKALYQAYYDWLLDYDLATMRAFYE